jgi:hypothetical protein
MSTFVNMHQYSTCPSWDADINEHQPDRDGADTLPELRSGSPGVLANSNENPKRSVQSSVLSNSDITTTPHMVSHAEAAPSPNKAQASSVDSTHSGGFGGCFEWKKTWTTPTTIIGFYLLGMYKHDES